MCDCVCGGLDGTKIPDKYFDSRYLIKKDRAKDAKIDPLVPNSAVDNNGYYSASEISNLIINEQLIDPNYNKAYVLSKNGVKYYL
jgi:hypothetical protein